MLFAVGVRWSFRGKDAGSARIGIRARLRTRPRGEQRGSTAQSAFRQGLLNTARGSQGFPARPPPYVLKSLNEGTNPGVAR